MEKTTRRDTGSFVEFNVPSPVQGQTQYSSVWAVTRKYRGVARWMLKALVCDGDAIAAKAPHIVPDAIRSVPDEQSDTQWAQWATATVRAIAKHSKGDPRHVYCMWHHVTAQVLRHFRGHDDTWNIPPIVTTCVALPHPTIKGRRIPMADFWDELHRAPRGMDIIATFLRRFSSDPHPLSDTERHLVHFMVQLMKDCPVTQVVTNPALLAFITQELRHLRRTNALHDQRAWSEPAPPPDLWVLNQSLWTYLQYARRLPNKTQRLSAIGLIDHIASTADKVFNQATSVEQVVGYREPTRVNVCDGYMCMTGTTTQYRPHVTVSSTGRRESSQSRKPSYALDGVRGTGTNPCMDGRHMRPRGCVPVEHYPQRRGCHGRLAPAVSVGVVPHAAGVRQRPSSRRDEGG